MSVFRLPDLGEGLHDAEIVAWHVKPGDEVRSGDTLVSVETDKAVVDVPSPQGGRIAVIHGEVGEHLTVGAPLVEFATAGGATDTGAVVGRLPTGDAAPHKAPHRGQPATATASSVKATPAVRAQARRLGVDLALVEPSGEDGHVTAADVERAAQEGAAGTAEIAPRAEPLGGPRRAMARNMARAHAEVAATTVTDEAIVDHWDSATDVTMELVGAVVAGCRAEPALNAWFDGRHLTRILHSHVDVGIAMDTPDGLFVPVLRAAESHDAAALRADLDRLKQAVADRSVAPGDLRNQTMTLSNFGRIGGRHAALMVMPPQVAILGAGGVAPRVVAIDGKPSVRCTLPLSLTFDHRAVTGGEAARFLKAVIDSLQHGH
jgi:pyruvate dehydrogenase E2 component (dihydrolipoamide acetyltransferase)